MRIIEMKVEVTDAEFEAFLMRTSGGDGRKVTTSVGGDDDDNVVNTNAPAVDKNNVAWHKDFHSGSKKINADGTWKRVKGLTEEQKAAADAYEASGTAAPVPQPIPAAPAVAAAPVPQSIPTAAAPVGMPGLPMPAAPVAPAPVSYEDVVALFSAALAIDPNLGSTYMQVYNEAGITDPNALTTNETLRASLANLLKQKYPAIVAA